MINISNDEEGRLILAERPRVNDETWNQARMIALPENTFGHHYAKWMSKFHFTPEDRTPTKYVPDLELAYIMQRYRETHDAIHVLLNYEVSVAEELAVKWFELVQLGLPSTALAAFVGPLNLILFQRDLKEMSRLLRVYLPHVLQQAATSTFFLNIYFEKHFERDIGEFRRSLGVRALVV